MIGYIRTSEVSEEIGSQRQEILDYGNRNGEEITSFIEVSAPVRKVSRQRRVSQLCQSLSPGDTLVAAELSRLGRSIGEVIFVVDFLMKYGVTVVAVKEGLALERDSSDKRTDSMVSLFALLAKTEHKYSSLRTKEVLAAKKSHGVHLGKRKGTIQASMYDKDREKIEELLRLGVSQRRIVQYHLGYGTANSLNHYIRTRGLVI